MLQEHCFFVLLHSFLEIPITGTKNSRHKSDSVCKTPMYKSTKICLWLFIISPGFFCLGIKNCKYGKKNIVFYVAEDQKSFWSVTENIHYRYYLIEEYVNLRKIFQKEALYSQHVLPLWGFIIIHKFPYVIAFISF